MPIRLSVGLSVGGSALSRPGPVAASPRLSRWPAARQDYPAFVLVAGLLLVGLVADDDGLFECGRIWLRRLAPSGLTCSRDANRMSGLVTAS